MHKLYLSAVYYHFTWEVSDFFNLPKENSYYLESGVFRFAGDRHRLRLYPNGAGRSSHVDVVLVRLPSAVPEKEVSFEIGYKSNIGREVRFHECNSNVESVRGIGFCLKRSWIENKRWEYVPDDKLTLYCRIRDINELPKGSPAYVSTLTNFVDLQRLSRDFSTLLKNESFSDVRLKCSDRTFSANRFILTVRSKVFAAMFSNNMAEAIAGEVNIKDVDPEVLEQLLEYMYSAKRPNLDEKDAYRLYKAADKYQVHDLRRACSLRMVQLLRTDNCLNVLVLAEEHSDENFKADVACFVAEHLEDLEFESWSTFSNKYPLLENLVLRRRCEDSLPKKQNAAKKAKLDLPTDPISA